MLSTRVAPDVVANSACCCADDTSHMSADEALAFYKQRAEAAEREAAELRKQLAALRAHPDDEQPHDGAHARARGGRGGR